MKGTPIRPRRRDLIRGLFGREGQATAGAVSQEPQFSAHLTQSSDVETPNVVQHADFYELALQRLSVPERETIQESVLGGPSIDSALKNALEAAEEKKEQCLEGRWTYTIRGHTIALQEKAQKVFLWLEKFAAVGDVAANADPIHAGLPWAGVKLILNAVTSDHRHMAELLTGMEVSLYMSVRLKTYFSYMLRLPQGSDVSGLKQTLVEFYSLILGFLARAIRHFQKAASKRALDAFIRLEDSEGFEEDCEKYLHRAHVDTENCERERNERVWDEFRAELQELSKLRKLDDSIGEMHMFDVLRQLPVVRGAAFGWYEDVHTQPAFSRHEDTYGPQCLEGTRVDILKDIFSWAQERDRKVVYWLCGMAGTGKSTISRSCCKRLQENKSLGASFFFKRGQGNRGNLSQFFPTLAAQLAEFVPEVKQHIAEVWKKDPNLMQKGLKDQFDKLIYEPMCARTSSHTGIYVIVIDALDECNKHDDIRRILHMFQHLGDANPNPRLRIFLTSRPEFAIQMGFKEINSEVYRDVYLHEIASSTIEHDIRLYLNHTFKIIKKNPAFEASLPSDWPGPYQIDRLIHKAVPLFIVAATICRFVEDPREHPKSRLDFILEYEQAVDASQYEQVYMPILLQLLEGRSKADQERYSKRFKEVLGSIILLAEPLSMNTLTVLLQREREDLRSVLSWLKSVLIIPENETEPIKLYHLSFRDFIIEPKSSNSFPLRIDERKSHELLFNYCLDLLIRPNQLFDDMCRLGDPGFRRSKIGQHQVERAISTEVSYACRYWVYHLEQSGLKLTEKEAPYIEKIYNFLRVHFLHWLESLSWLGALSDCISFVNVLSLTVQASNSPLWAFLNDAKRFVRHYRMIIDTAPLQIYSAALLFSPTSSIIRNTFINAYKMPFNYFVTPPEHWPPHLQDFEGHKSNVLQVTVSRDGRLLASSDSQGQIKLWDLSTGESLQSFRHEGRRSGEWFTLAFSHDDKMLRVVNAKNYKAWNLTSGDLKPVESHNFYSRNAHRPRSSKFWRASNAAQVSAGTSSPIELKIGFGTASEDGELVAAVTPTNDVVRICKAYNEESVQYFPIKENEFPEFAFSCSCKLFAIAYESCKVVEIRNISSGSQLLKLDASLKYPLQIAFSLADDLLAWALISNHIEIWSLARSKRVFTLSEHNSYVNSLRFSNDGGLLASASDEGGIWIWRTSTGETLHHIYCPNAMGIAFAPNQILASFSSGEDFVRLWDLPSTMRQGSIEQNRKRVPVLAFSNDGQLLAQGVSPGIIRIWRPATGTVQKEIRASVTGVTVLAFALNNNKLLASESIDGRLKLWDLSDESPALKLDISRENFPASGLLRSSPDFLDKIAISPDESALAIGTQDGVCIWEISTGECTRAFPLIGGNGQPQGLPIRQLLFSHDCRLLALSTWFGAIQIWDLWSMHRVEIHGIPDTNGNFSFSDNNEQLITDFLIVNIRISEPSSEASFSAMVQNNEPKFPLFGLRDRRWITYHGQDVLWLPNAWIPPYEPLYQDEIIVLGSEFEYISAFWPKSSADS